MKPRSILALVGGLAILGWIGWLLRSDAAAPGTIDPSPRQEGSSERVVDVPVANPPAKGSTESAVATLEVAPPRATDGAPPATSTGSLLVHVKFADDGTPGAQVGMWLDLGADGVNRTERTAFTDAEGSVRIEDLPVGPVAIELDRCAGTIAQVVAGTTSEVWLSIPNGIDAEARAVVNGNPVAEASIELLDMKHLGKPLTVTSTDAAGSAMVRDIAADRLLRASSPSYEPSTAGRIRGSPGERVVAFLQFGVPVESMLLRVMDSEGKPARGAQVEIVRWDGVRPPGAPPILETAAPGTARFAALPYGTWRYTIRHPGHVEERGSFEHFPREKKEVLIHLQLAGVVLGTVFDPAGQPADGVRVRLLRAAASGDTTTLAETSSEANGHYEITMAPTGAALLEFVDLDPPGLVTGLGSAQGAVVVEPASTTRFDAKLDTSNEIRGRLVGPSGEPLVRAEVDARVMDPQFEDVADSMPLEIRLGSATDWEKSDSVLTDRDGRFRIIRFDGRPRLLAFRLNEFQGSPIPQTTFVLIVDRVPMGSDRNYVVPESALPLSSFTIALEDPSGLQCKECDVRLVRLDIHETVPSCEEMRDSPGFFHAEFLVAARYRVTVRFRETDFPVIPDYDLAFREHWNAGTFRLAVPGAAYFRRPNADPSKPQDPLLFARIETKAGVFQDVIAVPHDGAEQPLPPGEYVLRDSAQTTELASFVIRSDEVTIVDLAR